MVLSIASLPLLFTFIVNCYGEAPVVTADMVAAFANVFHIRFNIGTSVPSNLTGCKSKDCLQLGITPNL